MPGRWTLWLTTRATIGPSSTWSPQARLRSCGPAPSSTTSRA
jgi:hypothetical protein